MATPTLPCLPTEILLEIQASLNYASQLALRLTCRELHAKVDDPNNATTATSSHSGRVYKMEDLLEIERWPAYNGAQERPDELKQPIAGEDFFACSACLKLRCASKFPNAMMKGKRGKLGLGIVQEKHTRLCIRCGMRQGRYQWGTQFQLYLAASYFRAKDLQCLSGP